MQKERTTNKSKTKAGSHTELHEVAELNKEGEKKKKPPLVKELHKQQISSSAPVTYTAFKLPSSSLEQERTQTENKVELFSTVCLKALSLKSLKQF